jgi:hypothetical protein
MRQIFTLLIVVSLLTACSRSDAQATIRDWCADNSEICDMNAVK